MLSSAASSRRLVPLRVSSCCLSRLMSLHTTIEPPSLVPLWLMRSQRPSSRRASPVGGNCACVAFSISGPSCAIGVPGRRS